MQIVKSQNTSTNNIAISIEIVEYLEENGQKEKKNQVLKRTSI